MANYDAGMNYSYTFRLNAWQASQDVGGNTSAVSWNLEIHKPNNGTSGRYADGPHYWSVNINGAVYSGSIPSYDFRAYTVLTLAAGTTTVGHNADGTKTIAVSAGFDDNNSWGELGDRSVSGNLGLTTIPRATTPTFTSPMEAGTAYTINLPRASTAFTHTVQYAFGSSGWVNIATGATTSASWTPPLSLLTQIPNATSGVGTIRVITYNGGTNIGTRDVGFTLSAPASVVPTFSAVAHSEATAGLAANVGAYVQGLTKLSLAISGAAGAYGSTITGYKITVAGQTINAVSGTTAPIALSGTVPVVATITDSRGRTASKTVDLTVLPYAAPAINAVSVQRAGSDGTPAEEGTYIRVNLDAAVQSLTVASTEKNALAYRISTRDRGTFTWTVIDTWTPGGVTFSGSRTVGTYSIEEAHDVLVEVLDDFLVSSAILTVPTAAIFMHLDSTEGVGIGKFREQGSLDVAGQIYQNDGRAVVDVNLLTATFAAFLPAGTVQMSAVTAATPPAGWLFCRGQAVGREQYPTLFAAIGTTYGAGDGSTTFNLPNLNGRAPVGYDSAQTEFNAVGKTGGAKTHTLTTAEMPSHTHTFQSDTQADAAGFGGIASTKRPAEVGYTQYHPTSSVGGGGAHNNLQPYIALNFIIKI
ncbi:DUF859 family phage minor structural protein [Agromyces larvae]|uniref:DUF859 domain-containing protein n=1 Tax=Agromyces larvae TaxID=2929802 RepID=A0ABY4C3W1_9MICO|nr:DUF859 family phage minor structural protein [Agromyces larvae]UOE45894.1 DUF859 domain-containing protein [Agromyces larvae]